MIKYGTIFFSANLYVELLMLAAHKRWILQAIKRFGDYYYRKYNNREVVQLIREIRIGSYCGIALLAVGEKVIRECLQLAKKTHDDNTLLHTINNVKLHMFT
ncbi:MAG: hypothetical protein WA364_06810 [Candidatus Nitrosopolaris sp.]